MIDRIPKDVRWLSAGFLVAFFGFDGIQQYITIFFRDIGRTNVGFISLSLIYASFMIAGWWAPRIINHLGARKSLLVAYLFYALYCFGLLTKTVPLIYLLSILIGGSAGVLWTAQNSYLVRVSDKQDFGRNAGFFSTSFAIGAGLGVLLMGLLIPHFGHQKLIFVYSSIVLLAGLFFLKLRDVKSDEVHQGNLSAILRSPTAVRYSMLWLAFNFIQGLVFGIIPLKIADVIGISAVGPLMALYFIAPILFSYAVGKSSDVTGRRAWTIAMLLLSTIGLLALAFANSAWLLIFGVVILAVNFGISRTITIALVGDVASGRNIENFSALVWAVQAGATLLALVISTLLLHSQWVYIIGLGISALSIIIVLPLVNRPLSQIREAIAKETA